MGKIETIQNYIKSSKTKEVLELLKDKEYLNTEESKAIFLFLYDYTNSFKNANTTPDILRLAGIMLESGIQHDKLIVEKTKKTFTQMKLCGDVIGEMRLYKDGTIVGTIISKEMLALHGIDFCIGESFMSNILITVSDCIFGFLLIEIGDLEYRVLLGSKFDINPLFEIRNRLGIDISNDVIRGKAIEEIISIITE